jgi:hypothetical protein
MSSEKTMHFSPRELRQRRRRTRSAGAVASSVIVAALLAMPASGIGQRLAGRSQQAKRETVSAVFQLTPRHRSASISHEFVHATVGFYSTRLVVPRGLRAQLLIRTSVESLTRQPPDVALCTPHRFCRARGLRGPNQCHDSGRSTICEQNNPPEARDPIFPPGRFTLTVREFDPKTSLVSLKAVFIRGYG